MGTKPLPPPEKRSLSLAAKFSRIAAGRSIETMRLHMKEAGYDIGAGTLHRMSRGEVGIRMESLQKLAAYGQMAVEDLVGEAEPDGEFVEVRRADVQFSNGSGKIVYFEDDRPPLSFRADFLRKIGIATGNALIVDAAGDSNWPKIHDGMVILVDRGKTTPNGEFFAFRYHDELLIKRLTKLDKVGILATAENSDFRPREKVYTADEMDRFEILGQCVWGAGLL